MSTKWLEILAAIPKTAPPNYRKSYTHVTNIGSKSARVVVMHGDGDIEIVTLRSQTSRSVMTSTLEKLTVALLETDGDDIAEMRIVSGGTNMIVQNAANNDDSFQNSLQLVCGSSANYRVVDNNDFKMLQR
ncbi:unnamed protein product [Meganyctiphanes norvegica]|uniref:Uncharacterized protein n=1 Tax=Meganyctiphanes norvegica TaxID=48144 RepID=A0AAV2SHP0_MEGNR